MRYRDIAKTYLKSAEKELSTGDDSRLKFAALELRMTLEALTYERAQLYKKELTEKQIKIWQPRKLLTTLIDIDPFVDSSPTISFGIEGEDGSPPEEMKLLGKETVISLKDIKNYYDRLSSYLHTPTIEQGMLKENSSPQRIRYRCEEIVSIMKDVVSSPIFNVDLRDKASLNCYECGSEIVRTIPPSSNELQVKCLQENCLASYIVKKLPDRQAHWEPMYDELPCSNPNCDEKQLTWKREFALGVNWNCKKCRGHNRVSLGITFEPVSSES
ncbi:hypothetical protein [Microbulbifer spongiae]|uniref:Uncharacterized protein n=1 Tax=Microbulbifer spongiae TaxID=2944933 RepID=A0ABY9E5C0_9GAMM|nr:hypothetical protein [Microbulbifer sp. MI-G]WKD48218.1 hypothetical protein M8T91_09725 [Microbulbifer sp. MI-G]